MAENHDEHEGPIHQAPWVAYLTVIVCYAVLALIMFAKFAADGVELGELGYLFAVQAGVITAFVLFFGGLLFFANKLIGAPSARD